MRAISTPDSFSEIASQAFESDDCQITAALATLQDRQILNIQHLKTAENSFLQVYNPVFVLSLISSDINQHSPPKINTPIFLRHRNFRI